MLRKLLTFLLALVVLVIGGAAFVYLSIPSTNTHLTHFDTIIVLGTPARLDGTPSPEQRERTLEGVREFKAGIAPHLIFTGGPAHNQFVEAHTMAVLALSQGVPPDAILEEGQAQNTVQNIFYSQRIMAAHGWTSAEVVSSPSHLPRTALILKNFSMQWSTHPAPWPPEYDLWQRAAHFGVETEYCLKLRLFGFPTTRFLPSHAQSPQPST
ncbi:MAG TPA: YdcF family protein [Edaphobacter sp.]|nr:YdcF family protein [Edaphobacter sp.]